MVTGPEQRRQTPGRARAISLGDGVAMTDCPFQPFSESYLADPYPVFSELRAETAAFHSDELDMWVVTRHRDAARVMADTTALSAANSQDPLLPFSPDAAAVLAAGFGYRPVMTNLDPPEHARIRRHNVAAFSATRVAALEPAIRSTVDSLLEPMLDRPRFDWVAGLSFPLPVYVIFDLVGFPRSDAEMVKEWTTDRLTILFGHPDESEQLRVAHNMAELYGYCARFVQHRRAHRADDVTSALLDVHDADPAQLSIEEITSVIVGLSIAGHETTTNLLSNCMVWLLRHRSQWQELCRDPALIPNAVEEVLRFDSSVNAWRRLARTPIELDGVTIPDGARILVLLGSANHDEEVFENPDRFDIRRPNARQHISFGKGIHYCLGAPLARLEARIVLEEITRRAPDLVLEEQALHYPPIISFRGPTSLWLARSDLDR